MIRVQSLFRSALTLTFSRFSVKDPNFGCVMVVTIFEDSSRVHILSSKSFVGMKFFLSFCEFHFTIRLASCCSSLVSELQNVLFWASLINSMVVQCWPYEKKEFQSHSYVPNHSRYNSSRGEISALVAQWTKTMTVDAHEWSSLLYFSQPHSKTIWGMSSVIWLSYVLNLLLRGVLRRDQNVVEELGQVRCLSSVKRRTDHVFQCLSSV